MAAFSALGTSLFDTLGAAERKKFYDLAKKLQLRPGEQVSSSDLSEDQVYLVETGAFTERFYYGARTVPIVRISGVGELLQTNRLFLATRFQKSELRAIHIENNSLCAWSVDDFLSTLKTSPDALLYLCHWYNQQAAASHLHLYEAVAHSAYYRLVNLLVSLANHYGYVGANNSTVLLPLKLTIKDLSECISVSRETGSNLFNKLRRKGIIGPGKFIKVELSKLREYAETIE